MTLSEKENFWLGIKKELDEKNLDKFTCNIAVACTIQDLNNFKSNEKYITGEISDGLYLIGELDNKHCYVDPNLTIKDLDIIHEKGSIKVEGNSFDFF